MLANNAIARLYGSGVVACLVVLMTVWLAFTPSPLRPTAIASSVDPSADGTNGTHLPNYDIREDFSVNALEFIAASRSAAG